MAKTKKNKPKSNSAKCEPMKKESVDVNIKKASNGYVVSSYDQNYNEKIYIAKTKSDAKKQASKMMKL